MGNINGNVVLITGASSGIGKSTAMLLMKNGFKVYGTSRKADPPYPAESSEGKSGVEAEGGSSGIRETGTNTGTGFIKMIQLDICDDDSVKRAVDYVLDKEGRIDILVNNAGFEISGAIEDTSAEEVYANFNTNLFGHLRMCRRVLPAMRRQKSGLIINIASVAGFFAIPFHSMLSASKSALDIVSEALRSEVKPFGIKVTVVEPGDTKTGYTENRKITAETVESSVYYKKSMKAINGMAKAEQSGTSPDSVARIIFKLINMKNPPIRKTVGIIYKVFVFLKRLLPNRFAAFVVEKFY